MRVAVPGAWMDHSWFKLVAHGRTLRLFPDFVFAFALCHKQCHKEHLCIYILTFLEFSVVLNQGQFCSQETLGDVWEHLSLSRLGVQVLSSGARAAAQCPTVAGLAQLTKNDLAPNVSSAEDQKPCH